MEVLPTTQKTCSVDSATLAASCAFTPVGSRAWVMLLQEKLQEQPRVYKGSVPLNASLAY